MFLYSYLESDNPLSLSVVSDRLVDALSISMIFLVNRISNKPTDEFHSYGFHRVEALLNITIITLFIAISAYSAILTTELLIHGIPISSGSTALSAIIAIPLLIVAGVTIEHDEKSNFRIMFIHTLQDLAIMIIVLAFSLLPFYFFSQYLDYLGSYIVLFIILYGNRNMFRRNVNILLEGSSVSVKEVEEMIRKEFPSVHHLHIWDICQHQRVATLHMSIPSQMQIGELDSVRKDIERILSKYGVNHVTVQFESNNGDNI
nr:cation diffusion facilitator family transporter [Ferroplasma acidiphilum]